MISLKYAIVWLGVVGNKHNKDCNKFVFYSTLSSIELSLSLD